MKYLALIIILFGAILFFNNTKENNELKVSQEIDNSKDIKEVVTSEYTAQFKQMGEVEVEVTPIKLGPGQDMVFNLTLNTHSVELSYDYKNIAWVEDNLGNEYKPQEWSGGEGGHHLEGELLFDELTSDSKNAKLIIDGIDGEITEFEWELKRG